jgi:hypothetical protein
MVLGVILIAYNIVDRIEQHTEAVIASEQAFRDGCLPRAGEMAIIVSNGRSARCRIYSSNSTGSGMASKMVSAAVIEVNP